MKTTLDSQLIPVQYLFNTLSDKMRLKYCYIILSAIALLSSCDEGRIYDDYDLTTRDGAVALLTGEISGVDSWGDGYNVAIAGFGDEEYAIVSKNIGQPVDGNTYRVELSGISSEVKTVELCIVNRLRRRVATFASVNLDATSDTIRLAVGDKNVSMFNAIQQQVFNTTCANCHGSSNFAAAGLYLTEGKSYDNLVGVKSRKMTDMMRVNPGNADQSVLYSILSSTASASWNYDHSVEVVDNTTLTLIKDWINSGAK